MSEEIKDYIYSCSESRVFATVYVKKSAENEFEYLGEIIENEFPEPLINAINEFHDAVEDLTFSVLDEIEDRIYGYDLELKDTQVKIHGISINGNSISFFTKYPSGSGYQDSRPQL